MVSFTFMPYLSFIIHKIRGGHPCLGLVYHSMACAHNRIFYVFVSIFMEMPLVSCYNPKMKNLKRRCP
ncbi:hypothetical protein CBFG_00518 [Clostridiales bacterium 1_7_47FAA]|nr:hypothetical protein CBFG_00518 [Clostridiales bacterium 1_7_47FAA]